jgi:stress response protein YsnF
VDTERGVRVHKSVTEREEQVVQLLYRESLDVQRIPRNEVVDRAPPVRHEGDTLVIPVCEEVLVLEKRLLLKEEIRVGRREQHVRHSENVVDTRRS